MRRQFGPEVTVSPVDDVTVSPVDDVTVSPETTSEKRKTGDTSPDSTETGSPGGGSTETGTPVTEPTNIDVTNTGAPSIGYVVLGDVVDSRSIEDRAAFRETFATARRAVETTLGETLAAGPTVLKGIDEIGLVLSSLNRLYDLVITLQDALHPHQIRLAVARGPVDTTVTDSVARMDGEAFHRATDLLESIDADGLLFGLDADRPPLDTAVTDEINLLVDRRASWTDRQREIVTAYERTGVQHEVASELGISQQAVSDVLQSADWPLVETIERRLRKTLATYEEHDR